MMIHLLCTDFFSCTDISFLLGLILSCAVQFLLFVLFFFFGSELGVHKNPNLPLWECYSLTESVKFLESLYLN